MDALAEFPSTSGFFKATDLAGKKLTLTISGVVKEIMKDGQPKAVVSFEDDGHRLILNVGNRLELVARFGADTDEWIGQQVTLISQRCNGPNGPTTGIRFADDGTTPRPKDELDEAPF